MKQEFYPGRIYENRKIGRGQNSRKYPQLREGGGRLKPTETKRIVRKCSWNSREQRREHVDHRTGLSSEPSVHQARAKALCPGDEEAIADLGMGSLITEMRQKLKDYELRREWEARKGSRTAHPKPKWRKLPGLPPLTTPHPRLHPFLPFFLLRAPLVLTLMTCTVLGTGA